MDAIDISTVLDDGMAQTFAQSPSVGWVPTPTYLNTIISPISVGVTTQTETTPSGTDTYIQPVLPIDTSVNTVATACDPSWMSLPYPTRLTEPTRLIGTGDTLNPINWHARLELGTSLDPIAEAQLSKDDDWSTVAQLITAEQFEDALHAAFAARAARASSLHTTAYAANSPHSASSSDPWADGWDVTLAGSTSSSASGASTACYEANVEAQRNTGLSTTGNPSITIGPQRPSDLAAGLYALCTRQTSAWTATKNLLSILGITPQSFGIPSQPSHAAASMRDGGDNDGADWQGLVAANTGGSTGLPAYPDGTDESNSYSVWDSKNPTTLASAVLGEKRRVAAMVSPRRTRHRKLHASNAFTWPTTVNSQSASSSALPSPWTSIPSNAPPLSQAHVFDVAAASPIPCGARGQGLHFAANVAAPSWSPPGPLLPTTDRVGTDATTSLTSGPSHALAAALESPISIPSGTSSLPVPAGQTLEATVHRGDWSLSSLSLSEPAVQATPHPDGAHHAALVLLLQDYPGGVGVRRLLAVFTIAAAKKAPGSAGRIMLDDYRTRYAGRSGGSAAERIINEASTFLNFAVRKSPSEKQGVFDQLYLVDANRPYFTQPQRPKTWHPTLGLTTVFAVPSPTTLNG
ncbi:hypothetical protein OC844_006204 [Tilletia horrida]|nr:hypothetical protein OC844_006204 [Tilletia horrida]